MNKGTDLEDSKISVDLVDSVYFFVALVLLQFILLFKAMLFSHGVKVGPGPWDLVPTSKFKSKTRDPSKV